MKVKSRNLCELIIQGLLLVLLFTPGMYLRKFWRFDTKDELLTSLFGGWWYNDPTKNIAVSFWHKNISVSNISVSILWITILVMSVAVILFLLQYIWKKEKSNLKICCVFPIVELVLFIAQLFFNKTSKGTEGNYTSYYSYSPYVLLPITIALMVALILVTLIGYLRAAKVGIIDDSYEEEEKYSTADELRKYKELLDDGVITQEEYEEKKRQLLNK